VRDRLDGLFAVAEVEGRLLADVHAFAGALAFGGQLLGLAISSGLRAAGEGYVPNSAHMQFLSGTDPDEPVELVDERLREGATSIHRRLLLRQGDRNLAAVEMSLIRATPENLAADGPEPPLVPAAGELSRAPSPFVTRWGFGALEIRHVHEDSTHPMWLRPRVPLPGDPATHAAAVAFVSDLGLVLVGRPSAHDDETVPVTADHTIWFHRPPSFDDWLLMDAQLVQRQAHHGLVSAQLFDAEGRRVATIAQGVRLRTLRT
jgi:acyl-CoA thioesterase-2